MCQVELIVRGWAGDSPAASAEETQALLVTHVLIDGEVVEAHDRASTFPVPRDWSALTFIADGFLEVHVKDPPKDIRDRYRDPARHLIGTDDDMLILPVSALTVTPWTAEREAELRP